MSRLILNSVPVALVAAADHHEADADIDVALMLLHVIALVQAPVCSICISGPHDCLATTLGTGRASGVSLTRSAGSPGE